MNLYEARQILNYNGFICEDAFRNNTDMEDIYAIIEAHGWNPDIVAKKIIEHYKNNIKPLKSDKQKYDVENFYKIPKKDEWFNFDSNSCIKEIINENESYVSLGLYNFCFEPTIEDNDKNSTYRTKLAIDEDVYNEWHNKLDNALNNTLKKVTNKSKYFDLTIGDSGLWFDAPYMFADMIVKFKKDISNIDKEKLVNELNKLINDIVMDKELNQAEYDAVSFALEV